MRVLCDTNVLVRAVSPDDVDHSTALSALAELRKGSNQPVLVPQCLYEFYAVATRPAIDNGMGIMPNDAMTIVEDFIELMPLLRDERTIFNRWLSLMSVHQVQGKQSHDGRLVAAMDRHSVNHLLTFNDKHFRRFTHLTILSPADVAKGIP
jgi:predicted nucleic acid-binding protein